LWPEADTTVRDFDVPFWGESGHPLWLDECLAQFSDHYAQARSKDPALPVSHFPNARWVAAKQKTHEWIR
jgi:hypothetical protein